jgi:hypothetical protein
VFAWIIRRLADDPVGVMLQTPLISPPFGRFLFYLKPHSSSMVRTFNKTKIPQQAELLLILLMLAGIIRRLADDPVGECFKRL